jgi:hypothetical protein
MSLSYLRYLCLTRRKTNQGTTYGTQDEEKQTKAQHTAHNTKKNKPKHNTSALVCFSSSCVPYVVLWFVFLRLVCRMLCFGLFFFVLCAVCCQFP